MDTVDDRVVLSEELTFQLNARSRADVENDPRRYRRERREKSNEWIAKVGGGIESVIACLLEKPPPESGPRPPARDIADALILLEDDAMRARCETIATSLWAKAEFGQRILILGCFPHRADWAMELTTKYLEVPGVSLSWEGHGLLLSSLHDRDLIMRLAKKRGVLADVLNLVPALGADAGPILGELLAIAQPSSPERGVALALSCIGTPEVAAVFAKSLRRRFVRPYAVKFFSRFPHLAKDALSELAKKRKTTAGDAAHAILASTDRGREFAAAADDTTQFAEEEELPAILRELPWRAASSSAEAAGSGEGAKKRSRKPSGLIADFEFPIEPLHLHWSREARARWVAHRELVGAKPEQDVARLEATLAATGVEEEEATTPSEDEEEEESTTTHKHNLNLHDALYPKALLLRVFRERPTNIEIWHAVPGHMLALYGDDPEVLSLVVKDHSTSLDPEIRLFVESPQIALDLARRDLLRVTLLEGALRWLEQFPTAAARGLIFAALSKEIKTRAGAEIGLRHLASRGYRPEIEQAIASLTTSALSNEKGEEVSRAIRAIIDLKAPLPVRNHAPKPDAATYRPNELRAPRLANGKAFSLDATRRLGELLCAYSMDPLFYRWEEIREACDARSLAEHAWDLAKVWDMNNAPASSRWMLHAVRHFGDDEVVRRLTPALKNGDVAWMLVDMVGDHHRETTNTAAVMELVTIYIRARRSTSKTIHRELHRLRDALTQVVSLRSARRPGVESIEDLVDQFVPTYPVEADGTITLDLGRDRVWKVTFNAQLRRILIDEFGEVASALPRTKGDPEKLRAAATLLADLDEDVDAIAELRTINLERSMISGRTWPYADFRKAWIDHPVMRHMACGVVWEALAGTSATSFRVAEDSSFANEDDDAVALRPTEEDVLIRVAHPIRLPPETRAKWRSMFADYKLLQPFDQLGRETPVLDAAVASGALDRDVLEKDRAMNGKSAATFNRDYYRLMRTMPLMLERAGWLSRATSYRDLTLPFGNGLYGMLDQMTAKISVSVLRDGERVLLRDVDDVVRCELLRALDFVAAGEDE